MAKSATRVFLAGAGPGAADLLTLRAARILKRADVILYDRLVSAEALMMANPGAEFIYAGKEEGESDEAQQRIQESILHHARAGKVVVRLKGGDPLIFGRGAEEWNFLAEHGIEVEVIPGVTSALAAPAAAGIPLTFRGLARGFAVVTGHCHKPAVTDWRRYAAVETLIVLMGVSRRVEIAEALIEAGRPSSEPAAFVERATTDRERVVACTLGEIARGRIEVQAPAVLIVGEVVRLPERRAAPCAGMALSR